jgi:hypothetical protein
MPRSDAELAARFTLRMLTARRGPRHMDAIMTACEIVRRAKRAKFPEGAIRALELDLAATLARWHSDHRWFQEQVQR